MVVVVNLNTPVTSVTPSGKHNLIFSLVYLLWLMRKHRESNYRRS